MLRSCFRSRSQEPQKRDDVVDVLLRQQDVRISNGDTDIGGKQKLVLFHHLFEALRRLRGNPHVDGLSRNLGDANSYVALDYSDIFETGRAPYKGSHGVSLFFRHDF